MRGNAGIARIDTKSRRINTGCGIGGRCLECRLVECVEVMSLNRQFKAIRAKVSKSDAIESTRGTTE